MRLEGVFGMILPRGLQDPGYQIMRNQNAGNFPNFLKAMTEACVFEGWKLAHCDTAATNLPKDLRKTH